MQTFRSFLSEAHATLEIVLVVAAHLGLGAGKPHRCQRGAICFSCSRRRAS